MQRFLSGRLAVALKIAAALAVLAYLVHFVSWEEVVTSFLTAEPWFVVAAVLLLPANLGLEVWLWHRLSSLSPNPPSPRNSVAAVLSGHAAGIVTPARSGEVVVRALYAGHTDTWRAGALALLHRILDFHAVVLISVPACLYLNFIVRPDPQILWHGASVVGVLSLALLTAILIRPHALRRLIERFLRADKWRRRVASLGTWPAGERSRAVAMAIFRYVVYVTQYALLLRGFGGGMSWNMAFLIGATVFYMKLLVPPITFTDVGIRESVSIYVGSVVSIASAAAFNAAFTLFAINLVVPALLGIPFLLSGGRGARTPVAAVTSPTEASR